MNDHMEQHAGYLIQQISHLLEQRFNKLLVTEGLSLSHARVIYLLFKNDGMTQSELQQDLLIKAPSLTKLIDILAEKGLVKREPSPDDARTKRIYLTAAGREKEKRLCRIKENCEQELLSLFSPVESAQLIHMLAILKQKLQ